MLSRTLIIGIAALLLPLLSAQAQEDLSAHWRGVWIVEGTLFRIGVEVENDEMRVRQIESLGFVWTSGRGRVDGNFATIMIEYAGVRGRIQA